jgi:hypothetical protein
VLRNLRQKARRFAEEGARSDRPKSDGGERVRAIRILANELDGTFMLARLFCLFLAWIVFLALATSIFFFSVPVPILRLQEMRKTIETHLYTYASVPPPQRPPRSQLAAAQSADK